MSKLNKSLMILIIYLASTACYADWDGQCLNDCFSTGHECNYCDYQCRVEYNPAYTYAPTNEYRCPF